VQYASVNKTYGINEDTQYHKNHFRSSEVILWYCFPRCFRSLALPWPTLCLTIGDSANTDDDTDSDYRYSGSSTVAIKSFLSYLYTDHTSLSHASRMHSATVFFVQPLVLSVHVSSVFPCALLPSIRPCRTKNARYRISVYLLTLETRQISKVRQTL